jgi:hypothetical protein
MPAPVSREGLPEANLRPGAGPHFDQVSSKESHHESHWNRACRTLASGPGEARNSGPFPSGKCLNARKDAGTGSSPDMIGITGLWPHLMR